MYNMNLFIKNQTTEAEIRNIFPMITHKVINQDTIYLIYNDNNNIIIITLKRNKYNKFVYDSYTQKSIESIISSYKNFSTKEEYFSIKKFM